MTSVWCYILYLMIFFALSFLLSLLLCINVCWSHIPRGRDGHGNRDVAKLSIKSKRLLWMLTLSSVKIRFKLSDCNALWRIWPWPCLPPLPDDSYLKYAAWIIPKMHLGLTYTHQEVIKNCHHSAFMIFFPLLTCLSEVMGQPKNTSQNAEK